MTAAAPVPAVAPDRVARAAALLIEARRTGQPLAALPEEARPRTAGEAYAVQDAIVAGLGKPVGGWKVGAPTPLAEPAYAPILDEAIYASPAAVPAAQHRVFGIEAEIAFRMARDLPPRDDGDRPYTQAEIVRAVEAIYPAIEIVESRFSTYPRGDKLSLLADHQSNGAFVYGPPVRTWGHLDLVRPPALVSIDDRIEGKMTNGNAGGDPLRLVTALANHLAVRTGGLKEGDFVTTGSVTPLVNARPGAVVTVEFRGMNKIRVTFTK